MIERQHKMPLRSRGFKFYSCANMNNCAFLTSLIKSNESVIEIFDHKLNKRETKVAIERVVRKTGKNVSELGEMKQSQLILHPRKEQERPMGSAGPKESVRREHTPPSITHHHHHLCHL
eukprot:TRINITY_DN14933_c0_g1_i2.p1 TRINITY_DN14933_c0_g1~~TRINITY_DN14933_c0_g1_i2.p1  ORF type:complete len:119 (+),score=16.49 TRINITY_DN14933_c0_g1_i2:172-528(+)